MEFFGGPAIRTGCKSPGCESIVQKSVFLTLLTAGCLCFALRDCVTIPAYDDDGDVARALYNSGTDDPIKSLTRVIDRQTTDPQSAGRLAETYRLRGSFWLQKHEPQQALSDFDAALQWNPSELAARFGRAECYRQLGDSDRADAEMRQATTIDLSDVFPGLKRFVTTGESLAAFFSTPAGAWLLVAAAWAILSTINLVAGWGPTSEAAGSMRRLGAVAIGLGSLQVLPLAVWSTLTICQIAVPVSGWLGAGGTLLCLAATLPMLHPPVRLRGTVARLPRVTDAAFLARIAELANQMHVPVPVVRLWPSSSGSQQAQAFAGCLPAPQLAVTDGILQRLAPAERDAIVAHELGHVANGSLWLMTAVIPVVSAITMGVSAWIPVTFAMPFGLVLAMGLRRIVSRPLELDADRRAARAIGFRDTAAALAKIHAVNSLANSGILALLAYATATHPSREMRLWSLHMAAPAEDKPQIAVCAQSIRRHRATAAAALVAWLFILFGTLAAGVWAPETPLLALPLVMTAWIPGALLILANWRQISVARRRLGGNWLRPALLAAAVVGCAVVAIFPETVEYVMAPLTWLEGTAFFLVTPLLMVGVALAMSAWLQRRQASQRLRGNMALALQLHDFQRVLEIGRSAPAAVARDYWLRYHMEFSRAASGDRSTAIDQFEELWRDEPGFPMTALTLGTLLLDADQPERALDVARWATGRLPDDAATHLLVAKALRRLGRLDEAQAAADRALALEPEGGLPHAIAAAIALDSGDLPRAQALADKALDLGPGEVYSLLVNAEVALQAKPDENPRAAVEQALAAVRANPFAFYRPEVEQLSEWLRHEVSGSAVMQSACRES